MAPGRRGGADLHRTGLAAELGQAADDGLAAAQALGDGRIELAMLALAAEAETARGESAGQAADRLQHAAEQAGAEREAAIGLRLRGQAAARRGDHATAMRRLDQARKDLLTLGDQRQVHIAQRLQARSAIGLGFPEAALAHSVTAEAFFRALHDQAELLAASAVRARALAALDRTEEAHTMAATALERAEALRLVSVAAELRTTLAHAHEQGAHREPIARGGLYAHMYTLQAATYDTTGEAP